MGYTLRRWVIPSVVGSYPPSLGHTLHRWVLHSVVVSVPSIVTAISKPYHSCQCRTCIVLVEAVSWLLKLVVIKPICWSSNLYRRCQVHLTAVESVSWLSNQYPGHGTSVATVEPTSSLLNRCSCWRSHDRGGRMSLLLMLASRFGRGIIRYPGIGNRAQQWEGLRE